MPLKTSRWFSTEKSLLEENESEHGRETKYTSNQFVVKCSVRGHHVYKHYVVLALVSRLRHFARRTTSVAVHLNNCLTVIWHIPREITRTCHFFIKNKGEITGEVSGRRQRCTASCGGVEVPCLLTFYHRGTRVFEKAEELVTKKFVLA